MTEWEATRHLGFGSATVLKKLVGSWVPAPASSWLPMLWPTQPCDGMAHWLGMQAFVAPPAGLPSAC